MYKDEHFYWIRADIAVDFLSKGHWSLCPYSMNKVSMNKILQLGLQSSVINVAKFLVVPIRSLSVGSSIVGVGVGTRSVNKRLMSNATVKSIPFSINNSKGKEVLEIVGAATDQNCHQMGSDCGRAEMGTLQDDRKDIEAMTVQELRATLRKLGIPVKGRKQELISTLRLHMDSNLPDQKETTSSTRSESVTIKRKIRNREEPTGDECINSEAYGIEHGEKKEYSTEKNLKAKVSAKAVSKERKSLTKRGSIKFIHL